MVDSFLAPSSPPPPLPRPHFVLLRLFVRSFLNFCDAPLAIATVHRVEYKSVFDSGRAWLPVGVRHRSNRAASSSAASTAPSNRVELDEPLLSAVAQLTARRIGIGIGVQVAACR
ncbi:hypothetical protein V9T40_008270 [Parthenolecanium corni]|uniref:Uncharacterized protein n=1 Tax=Parthenolecanium corni TaxID=536013 RepID=A0AAN9Y6X9_9HEMI